MIMSSFAVESTQKEVTRMEQDDEGNVVRIKETTNSLKPNEIIRAIEVLGRLQGWGNDVQDEELSKVDELLKAMEVGVKDD